MADEPSLPAASPVAANSPAAAPVADSAPSQAAHAVPAASESAVAAESPSRPAAYEGSEPSLLQQTGVEAEAKAAEAVKPDDAKPAESAKPAEAAKPEDGKAAEAKPAEAKAAEPAKEGEKPAEAAKPEAPAAVEYKYELPAAIKLDDTTKTALHGVLDAFRADPTNVQPLVDFHNARMAEFTETATKQIADHNRTVFNEMRAENRKAIMADPVLGGSGFQTTQGAVARMRDLLIPKDMLEPRKFDDGKPRLSVADEFLESTGAGDHPVLWHMLHNAARYLDEPQAAEMPNNPRPPKNHGKPPGRGKLRDLYTHSRSNGQT